MSKHSGGHFDDFPAEEGILYEIEAEAEERFNALLKQLGPPDHDAARAYLATREVVKPEDPETAALIARVEEKIAALDSAHE